MKIKRLTTIFAWLTVTLLLYGLLRDMLYTKVALPLWKYIGLTEGRWLNASVSLAIVCCVLLGWKSKKNIYSARHIGILVSVITLVLLFYFDNTTTPYLYYFGIIPCWLAILSAYLVGIGFHHLSEYVVSLFKNKQELLPLPKVLLFQDKPIDTLDEDGLAYNALAQRIASSIIQNTWEESFSIGIAGSWGAGKSSMLHLIKNCLKNRNDIIVIEFSPRQSATLHDIQKDFLSQLSDSLSHFHSGAQRVAQKYMQSLGALPDSLWAARVFGTISDVEITKRRDGLKAIIKEIGKKIVVLVDDFDRLSGEEIQEVLKLIDKNAAFPKTFFVTAYDKKQTNQVISAYLGQTDNKGSKEKVDYTDKYFNLEVSLPLRRQSNYVRVLRQNLYALVDGGVVSCTKEDIDKALPRVYPFISSCLSTIRDTKRYCNLVALALPQIENNVLLGDFLLVTLIRYKYPEEFDKLGHYSYVVREGSTIPKKKYYQLNSGSFENVGCKDILKALFNGKESAFKSISHVNSFSYYFYDMDSGHLLYEELSVLLNPEIATKEFKTKVEQIVKTDSQKSDFVEFILSQEKNIHSLEDTLWYLKLFLMARTYCDSHDLYIATLSYLLKDNVKENMKQFCVESDKVYAGLFKDVLDDRFDYWLSIESLHDALHAVTTLDMGEEIELIFTYEELKSLALKKLRRAISDIPTGKVSTDDVYRTMRACVSEYLPEPNGPGETIMQEAIDVVKEAIITYPDFFFKGFLSHRKDPKLSSAIQFYIDDKIPYRALFKGLDEMSSFISELNKKWHDSKALLCLSQYTELCVAQKTWNPTKRIQGDISQIQQHDYEMYNHLFEGEPTHA